MCNFQRDDSAPVGRSATLLSRRIAIGPTCTVIDARLLSSAQEAPRANLIPHSTLPEFLGGYHTDAREEAGGACPNAATIARVGDGAVELPQPVSVPIVDCMCPVRLLPCPASVTATLALSSDGVAYIPIAAPLPPSAHDRAWAATREAEWRQHVESKRQLALQKIRSKEVNVLSPAYMHRAMWGEPFNEFEERCAEAADYVYDGPDDWQLHRRSFLGTQVLECSSGVEEGGGTAAEPCKRFIVRVQLPPQFQAVAMKSASREGAHGEPIAFATVTTCESSSRAEEIAKHFQVPSRCCGIRKYDAKRPMSVFSSVVYDGRKSNQHSTISPIKTKEPKGGAKVAEASDEEPVCRICRHSFGAMFTSVACANCGAFVCGNCSGESWLADMIPVTYSGVEPKASSSIGHTSAVAASSASRSQVAGDNPGKPSTLCVCDCCQYTLLQWVTALQSGDLVKAQAIYATGNINVLHPYSVFAFGDYAVHFAARGGAGALQVMRWLLEEVGASLTTCDLMSGERGRLLRNRAGLSVLDIAVLDQNAELVKYLIGGMCSLADIDNAFVVLQSDAVLQNSSANAAAISHDAARDEEALCKLHKDLSALCHPIHAPFSPHSTGQSHNESSAKPAGRAGRVKTKPLRAQNAPREAPSEEKKGKRRKEKSLNKGHTNSIRAGATLSHPDDAVPVSARDVVDTNNEYSAPMPGLFEIMSKRAEKLAEGPRASVYLPKKIRLPGCSEVFEEEAPPTALASWVRPDLTLAAMKAEKALKDSMANNTAATVGTVVQEEDVVLMYTELFLSAGSDGSLGDVELAPAIAMDSNLELVRLPKLTLHQTSFQLNVPYNLLREVEFFSTIPQKPMVNFNESARFLVERAICSNLNGIVNRSREKVLAEAWAKVCSESSRFSFEASTLPKCELLVRSGSDASVARIMLPAIDGVNIRCGKQRKGSATGNSVGLVTPRGVAFRRLQPMLGKPVAKPYTLEDVYVWHADGTIEPCRMSGGGKVNVALAKPAWSLKYHWLQPPMHSAVEEEQVGSGGVHQLQHDLEPYSFAEELTDPSDIFKLPRISRNKVCYASDVVSIGTIIGDKCNSSDSLSEAPIKTHSAKGLMPLTPGFIDPYVQLRERIAKRRALSFPDGEEKVE